jgi:5-formyltetrahydrofolate cyclo-ligase
VRKLNETNLAMTESSAFAKASLRQKMRARISQISLTVRMAESMELCGRLEPQLQSAHAILFFAPLPDELDVWPLLQKLLPAKKICALPAFDADQQHYVTRRVKDLESDIMPGKFGISEPLATCETIPMDDFDLVLVPGMAFDLNGHRLGRGRGFYDRILSAASGIKCGVAYDFQLLEKIPTEPHDARVNFIFTPNGCVRRRG